MQKIVHCNQEKLEYAYLQDFGGFNDLPTPYREISQHEWIHLTMSYCPKYRAFRQVKLEDEKVFKNCRIEFYHDYALALLYPNSWHAGKDEFGADTIIWEDKLRYFRIGCQHKWNELTPQECHQKGISHSGQCWHVLECQKCNITTAYDSSD